MEKGTLIVQYNQLFGENLTFHTKGEKEPLTVNDNPTRLDYCSEEYILPDEVKTMINPIIPFKLPSLDPLRKVYLYNTRTNEWESQTEGYINSSTGKGTGDYIVDYEHKKIIFNNNISEEYSKIMINYTPALMSRSLSVQYHLTRESTEDNNQVIIYPSYIEYKT